jgi:Tripartite tricarboxylate transporter family receptor
MERQLIRQRHCNGSHGACGCSTQFDTGAEEDELVDTLLDQFVEVRHLQDRNSRLHQEVGVDGKEVHGSAGGVCSSVRLSGDGYTLSIGQTTSNVFGVAVYTLPYGVLADFEPVALISTSALMMIGRAGLAALRDH